MMRVRLALTIAVTGVLALIAIRAPDARATEVTMDPPIDDPRTGCCRGNAVIQGGGRDNEIEIETRRAERTLLITDSAGRVRATSDLEGIACESISIHRARCEGFPFSYEIDADGGRGDDHISVDRDVTHRTNLRGGPGHDLLRGGRGRDHLVGGHGGDLLRGRRGRDVVGVYRAFDPGRDRLLGGRGNDYVASSHKGVDRQVSCSIGHNDKLLIDHRERAKVHPTGCERIEIRGHDARDQV